ncbi:LPXTG cell wall anchor domain-containing protein [Lacticaseibacillus chiayiensis]|uniref:LPXTG cell wall anchor domain-containing protein n=1 Tax=Lacticaseibacillus chiayiensis TaxID=2100821 RepID=UPI001BCD6F47|nr:LPXTG cell wall anchor domain-containing protein [Lacticaseibacillus chiayiensis]QVI34536.1 LPXTG cell wall anchor domain-containing protein [Lacticaseibacillus chiayiensis]
MDQLDGQEIAQTPSTTHQEGVSKHDVGDKKKPKRDRDEEPLPQTGDLMVHGLSMFGVLILVSGAFGSLYLKHAREK